MAGGSGPLHLAMDTSILQISLYAFPTSFDATHELGRTDPFL
jgi:hypothetical protein